MEKEERNIPSSALLPQEIFPEGTATLQLHNTSLSAWCAPQNHLSLFTKWTPHSWYPLTFREYLSFVLVQEEHKDHLGGYPESRGFPGRISGKNLHSKSTLSPVLLQDTAIKINPSSLGTSDFRFMPLGFCTGITLDYFPWGAQCLCFIWPNKSQVSQTVSEWTSLRSRVDQLSFKPGEMSVMAGRKWLHNSLN